MTGEVTNHSLLWSSLWPPAASARAARGPGDGLPCVQPVPLVDPQIDVRDFSAALTEQRFTGGKQTAVVGEGVDPIVSHNKEDERVRCLYKQTEPLPHDRQRVHGVSGHGPGVRHGEAAAAEAADPALLAGRRGVRGAGGRAAGAGSHPGTEEDRT